MDTEIDPNVEFILNQIPLDQALYVENGQVLTTFTYEVEVDNFEQLLKELIEKSDRIYEENMKKPCAFCQGNTIAVCVDCDKPVCEECVSICEPCQKVGDFYCKECNSGPLCTSCQMYNDLVD